MKLMIWVWFIIATALPMMCNSYYLYIDSDNLHNFTQYYVGYNNSIGQANYVAYISTGGHNNFTGCTHWRRSTNYTTTDYTNIGFDRGHLTPDADYGEITCTLFNVVPMFAKFNRGAWKVSENGIRECCAGQLVIKGCEYNLDNRIITHTGKIMYIPLGCYYIVTDNTVLNLETPFKILEYGYLINTNITNSTIYKILPWWIYGNDGTEIGPFVAQKSAAWRQIIPGEVIIVFMAGILILLLSVARCPAFINGC